MEFSYGQGMYEEKDKRIEGEIILAEHKLYLRDQNGELAQTFIPLEKIERLKKTGACMEVHTRPSLYFRYVARIRGERKYITDLVRDIVKRRQLKKLFLKNEWIEDQN